MALVQGTQKSGRQTQSSLAARRRRCHVRRLIDRRPGAPANLLVVVNVIEGFYGALVGEFAALSGIAYCFKKNRMLPRPQIAQVRMAAF